MAQVAIALRVGLGVMMSTVTVVWAQDNYPSRPLRIITAAAGGGSDFVARLVAQGISGSLGQPVVVDNRARGGIAAEIVSRAPPDGYNLTVCGGGCWIPPLFLQKPPYDIVRDFAPVTLVVREINVLAVNPSVPAKSVTELISLAKAKPGTLNYPSPGAGSAGHLAMELFKSMAGINLVHIAYKGNAPGVTALMSGEVHVIILDVGLLAPHMKSGKLRALAVTSPTPSALAPGLPTVASSGLPGYEATGMTGIFAAAHTPPSIIGRLNREIVRTLNLPETKERLFNSGVEMVGSSPEQFAAAVKLDVNNARTVIKEAGIKLE